MRRRLMLWLFRWLERRVGESRCVHCGFDHVTGELPSFGAYRTLQLPSPMPLTHPPPPPESYAVLSGTIGYPVHISGAVPSGSIASGTVLATSGAWGSHPTNYVRP
jgi:hypothetical protein